VGRASALLEPRRVAASAALAVLLGAYYAFNDRLAEVSTAWEVAFLGLVLMPVVFALVWLALPLRRARGLFLLAVGFLLVTVVLEAAGLEAVANFTKLAVMTTFAFWFLDFFESVLWVAVVALIIPIVDSISVWRGPTRHIVEEQPQVFEVFSFAFPSPGGETSANLGLPDLLFFALFLAAAAKWNLRVGWTWIALTASLGLTMLLTVVWDVGGLPALPGLAFGFLLPNADLLWAAFLRWRRLQRLEPEERDAVGHCLEAAVHGPFLPDEEFGTLIGLTRTEVERVLESWPDSAAPLEQDLAVNNVLLNLLRYPHGKWEAWHDYIDAEPQEVAAILAKWRGSPKRAERRGRT
jgi:hypothetical protein